MKINENKKAILRFTKGVNTKVRYIIIQQKRVLQSHSYKIQLILSAPLKD